MDEKSYWTNRRAEEIRKLKLACGASGRSGTGCI